MADIIKIMKDGVTQYPITKPECVIDENGKNVLQLIRENAGGDPYDDTELRQEVAELSVETMTLQYPELIDVTHLFFRDGLFASNLSQGRFSPNKNISGAGGKYCAVFKTKVGDIFEIVNLKGASSTKAWYKYDATGKIISNADASVTINETLVMEHEGYIVFNHYGTPSDVFSVKTTAEIFPVNIEIGFENLKNDTELIRLEVAENKETIDSLNKQMSSQSIGVVKTGNVIDYDKIENGVILDSGAGTTHASGSYSTTDLIPVVGNATYVFSTTIRRMSQYDLNGNFIEGTSVDQVNSLTTTLETRYIKVSASTDQIGTLVCKIVNGEENPYRLRDPYGNIYAIEQSMSDKNIIIFGDSSTDPAATNWFNRMCEALGVVNYKNFAGGGKTILNQEGVTTNYLKASIEQAIQYVLTNWGGKVDVIMLQIGGNDMSYLPQIGSAEDAFSSYNYLTYKDDKTIYGSLRYCLELLRRTYPQALITMGTVFGRLGSDYDGNAKEINDVIKTCCDAMKIQVIDGGKYMGFSPFTEVSVPYYNDGNPNVANDRSALSRENPAYNFINDATGEIVTYDVATDGGVLKSGYSKRYGLYTYDGKHQTKEGEDKVMKFMYNELKKLV